MYIGKKHVFLFYWSYSAYIKSHNKVFIFSRLLLFAKVLCARMENCSLGKIFVWSIMHLRKATFMSRKRAWNVAALLLLRIDSSFVGLSISYAVLTSQKRKKQPQIYNRKLNLRARPFARRVFFKGKNAIVTNRLKELWEEIKCCWRQRKYVAAFCNI